MLQIYPEAMLLYCAIVTALNIHEHIINYVWAQN